MLAGQLSLPVFLETAYLQEEAFPGKRSIVLIYIRLRHGINEAKLAGFEKETTRDNFQAIS